MGIASELDHLGATERSAAQRMREALELFEDGVEMKRRSLKRQFPEASPQDRQDLLLRWLAREDDT